MEKNKSDFSIEEKHIFVWVLAAASLAFLLVMLPFAAPLLWACVLAVLFHPIKKRLLGVFPGRENISSLVTLLVAILVVVIPVVFILSSVIGEATNLFRKYESGEINVSDYLDKITSAFPIAQEKAASFGFDLDDIKEKLNSFLAFGVDFIAKQSISIGQNTLGFFLSVGLMLYLAFFMLRDGKTIVAWMKVAFPLDDARETLLLAKFSEVTRATVKGNLVVGLVQGALGGGIFWVLGVQPALLWGMVMAIASLIPAVGTALIWAPVAIYLLAIGDYIQGISLIAFGVLVIGMVDNILRPILVGRDTKLPDYIVLLSTLGGLALVGIHGFVVGPLIAALFFALWNMFILEFNPEGVSHLKIGETDSKDSKRTDDRQESDDQEAQDCADIESKDLKPKNSELGASETDSEK